MKGDGSIVPGGIIVISLEIVRVLASMRAGASEMPVPNKDWNFCGSTFDKRSEKENGFPLITLVKGNWLQIQTLNSG